MMYNINFWGRNAQELFLDTVPNEYVESESGRYSYFFDDKCCFEKSKSFIQSTVKKNNYHVALDFVESDIAHYKVIARMNLVYNGHTYPYEYTFGYGYNPDSARYMFFEGNYSCDCNLYEFLHEEHGDEVGYYEDYPCGDSIAIEDFEIVLKHFEEV